MAKPLFSHLAHHYPSNKNVSKEQLYRDLGWDDLIDNPAYDNTCAVRVSLALIKSGVPIKGRFRIHKGTHKGSSIEPGQARLSALLAQTSYFGPPEKFKPSSAAATIGTRNGVVSFMKIPGYLNGAGGHIDILSSSLGGFYACGSDCYWDSSEVWFWELK